uniref:Chromo domain-containing protein n=1 Tax=Panagrolaimus sp. JU765 TaxID=591449 RepID=A0AC34Q6M5_9BILA
MPKVQQKDPYANDPTLYFVEEIEDKVKKNGEWYYVIKWEGFEERTVKLVSDAEVEIPDVVEKFEGRKCLEMKGRRRSSKSSTRSRASSKRAPLREISSDDKDTEIVPSPSRKRRIVESDEEEVVHFVSEDVTNQNGCENENLSLPIKAEVESEISNYVLTTPKPKKRQQLKKKSSITASTNRKKSTQNIQMVDQLDGESDDSSCSSSRTLETRCELNEERKEPTVSSSNKEEICLPVKVEEPIQDNKSWSQSCIEEILDEKHLFSTPIADDVAYLFIVPVKLVKLFQTIDLSKCKLLRDMVDNGEVKVLFLDMRKNQIFTDLTGRRMVQVFNDGDDLLDSISEQIVEFIYGAILFTKTKEKRLLIKLKNYSDNILINVSAKSFIDKYPELGNLLADQITYYSECIAEIDRQFELCDENIDLVKNSLVDSKFLAEFISKYLEKSSIAEEEALKLCLEAAKVWARAEIQSVENDDSFKAVKCLFESRDMMCQITEDPLSSWLNKIRLHFQAPY